MTSVVTASAAPLAGIEEEDNNGGFNLEDGSEAIFNGTSIHYSRSATIFAAVAASIFTFVGITGKSSERHFYSRKKIIGFLLHILYVHPFELSEMEKDIKILKIWWSKNNMDVITNKLEKKNWN